MSSHSPSAGHAHSSSPAPWIAVAALIAGALGIGGALVAGSIALLVVGCLLVLAGLVFASVLAWRGRASLSYSQEYPRTTYGPRGTTDGDSSPPIDTQPHDESAYKNVSK
jgi:hypothetical protein